MMISGSMFGVNNRLMIIIPCCRSRRKKGKQGERVVNITFLLDTGSFNNFLCPMP
jgi:hypothetical protein